MDFLKRVTEGLTHAEERNAIAKAKEAEQVHQVQIEKSEVEVIPALISVTPDQVTALTGEAEITTLQSATVDMVARAPVIDETIILEQKEIIQPVIHREIEKTEVRHVIQPIYQEETLSTKIHERTLEPEIRAEIRAAPDVLTNLQVNAPAEPTVVSTTAAAQTITVVNEAIVHEIIKPHIIEEVQPVIHRTIHEPHIIHERKDIYEKIVEAPIEIVETRPPIFEKEIHIDASGTRIEQREAL